LLDLRGILNETGWSSLRKGFSCINLYKITKKYYKTQTSTIYFHNSIASHPTSHLI